MYITLSSRIDILKTPVVFMAVHFNKLYANFSDIKRREKKISFTDDEITQQFPGLNLHFSDCTKVLRVPSKSRKYSCSYLYLIVMMTDEGRRQLKDESFH